MNEDRAGFSLVCAARVETIMSMIESGFCWTLAAALAVAIINRKIAITWLHYAPIKIGRTP
jgi:hypothetical protein